VPGCVVSRGSHLTGPLRFIFTPEWVSPRLFQPGFETYVALLPVLPIVYSDAAVVMEVSYARLLFRPRRLTDETSLLRAEEMARIVLRALPETPVQAVGINFSYVEDLPPDHLVAAFNDVDDVELGGLGWSIGERKLTRSLTRGLDLLNLSMTYKDKVVTFDLNFHSEATSNAAALDAVMERRALALMHDGQTLLEETYRLELEDEDADHA
jgi:hypothetical protein